MPKVCRTVAAAGDENVDTGDRGYVDEALALGAGTELRGARVRHAVSDDDGVAGGDRGGDLVDGDIPHSRVEVQQTSPIFRTALAFDMNK